VSKPLVVMVVMVVVGGGGVSELLKFCPPSGVHRHRFYRWLCLEGLSPCAGLITSQQGFWAHGSNWWVLAAGLLQDVIHAVLYCIIQSFLRSLHTYDRSGRSGSSVRSGLGRLKPSPASIPGAGASLSFYDQDWDQALCSPLGS
jgi:hypothetical protein